MLMKRLIRSKADGKYFDGRGRWSDEATRALCFEDSFAAFKAAKKHHLANVELVLMMGEEPSSYDVIMELKTSG